jgi:hypothetical protein
MGVFVLVMALLSWIPLSIGVGAIHWTLGVAFFFVYGWLGVRWLTRSAR